MQKMTKEELENIVDDLCYVIRNVTWGKNFISEWDGDTLCVYPAPNAEHWDGAETDFDLDDIGLYVRHVTGYDYDAIGEHRIGIRWTDPICHGEILGYEIRKDVLVDGTEIYDVYELMDGNYKSCVESLKDMDTAVQYIRENLNWKGEIK